ncbi:ATP-grasp domain-containing protein [Kitasatospora sp. NPDC059571]|uniref:ATP-grasp domain-containing protein n=1 Tax=Kitasatospora sp. NPDC059571 TaxID=3346871 RepID=UPI0036C5F6BA
MVRIAIVEPRSAGHRLIDRAAELGHEVVVVSAGHGERRVPDVHLAHAALVETVDTNDDAATLARLHALHAAAPLAAVVPGFEHYVPLAAAAAAALALPGLSAGTAVALRHKHVMREVLRAHGIDQPAHVLVEDEALLDAALAAVGLPCVVKPVDQSGSLNVCKAATPAEARAAFRRIRDYGAGYLDRAGLPLVLVEEYVDGPEFSVEGYAEGGRATVLGVTEKQLGPEPWFVEVGHLLPARLDAAATAAVERYTRRVVEALGLELGPFHAELRMSARGPLLMEVAARLPGDRIPDLLRLATGTDLYEIALRCHLGLPAAPRPPSGGTGHAGIRFLLRPDLDRYRAMVVDPGLRADPRIREIGALVEPGAPIPPGGSSSSRLGYVLAAGPGPDDTAQALDAAERGVCFTPPQTTLAPAPRTEHFMGRHVLILNRWNNRFAEYHRYLDHRADRVAYLTTEAGRGPLDASLAEEIRVVADLSDRAEVTAAAAELAAAHGPFTHVLALSEFDLELGAELREALGVPGKGVAEVRLVRDKVVMKAAVAAAGLRVPANRPVADADGVRAFAAEHGFPFVLKPRAGADSQGVHVVEDAARLAAVLERAADAGTDLTDHQCEEFIDGTLYQVDGVVSGGELRTVRSWRCLGSCLDFAVGSPFGSVANDDPAFEARVVEFTRGVLAALQLTDDVFHLEVFRTAGTDELVFLEIGARAGGGQVRFVWEEVYGLDLIEASVHVQLGIGREYPRADVGGEVAGYLMMPEPPVRPAVVHRVAPLTGAVPELYAEALPPAGTVLDGNGGAVHTAGAFRFRAATSAQVQAAIETAVKLYEIDWSPAGAPGV